MIITNNNDVTVKGNVGSNSVAMTIDPEAMEHIMSVLTNMYSNNHLAVAREYVANALDSHTEAGQTRPVEVISPSDWEPRLIIRDFGVGLSADEILNVYGVYGRSTRREDNNSIGGLGLGSKSGFTLSGQFVVTGIKNGEKTVALFSLDSNGAPTMEVLAQSSTDESNGVTVSIAVDNVGRMKNAIASLSRTWPKDRILVDGSPLRNNVYDDATDVGGGVFLVDASWGLTVDMGGVAYSVPISVLNELGKTDALSTRGQVWLRLTGNRMGIIARVPIGGVAIAPNRETLRNTPKTLETLNNILDQVGSWYTAEFSRICSEAASGVEASVLLFQHTGLMGQSFMRSMSWNGSVLKDMVLNFPNITLEYNRGRHSAVESTRPLVLKSVMSEKYYRGNLFVTGVKPEDSNKVRRLATRYLLNGEHDQIVVVEDAKGSVGWFSWGDNEYITTMTLDEFREAVRKIPSVSERNETRYPYAKLILNSGGHLRWDRQYPPAVASTIAEESDGEIYFGGSIYNYTPKAFNIGDVVVWTTNRQKRANLESRIGQTLKDASDVAEEYSKTVVDTASDLDVMAVNNDCDYSRIVSLDLKFAGLNYVNDELTKLADQAKMLAAHKQSMSSDRVAELHEVRNYLPAVDDHISKGYDGWTKKYYLVKDELRNYYRWGYEHWKPEFTQHMIGYMKMIDSKEDKNV